MKEGWLVAVIGERGGLGCRHARAEQGGWAATAAERRKLLRVVVLFMAGFQTMHVPDVAQRPDARNVQGRTRNAGAGPGELVTADACLGADENNDKGNKGRCIYFVALLKAELMESIFLLFSFNNFW